MVYSTFQPHVTHVVFVSTGEEPHVVGKEWLWLSPMVNPRTELVRQLVVCAQLAVRCLR